MSWPSPSLPGAPVWNGCWWPGTADGWTCRGLAADGTPFQPFAFGGTADTSLLLGFGQKPEETLRLWFQVHQPDGVQRNPPDRQARLPRTLCWEMEGAGPVEPLQDETWALSWSGYVTLPAPEAWQAGGGRPVVGCACARPRAAAKNRCAWSGLSAGRYQALQQETRAASYFFTGERPGGLSGADRQRPGPEGGPGGLSAGRHGLAADRAL